MKNGTEQIGEIGVDAGLCWIGDPCYIMHQGRDEKETPEYNAKEWASLKKVVGASWSEFCDKIDKKQFNYPLGHSGLGVCFGEFGGDGTYPVYAEYENGLIKKVWINFNCDEDETTNNQKTDDITKYDTLYNAWECLGRCEGKRMSEDRPHVNQAYHILTKLVRKPKREVILADIQLLAIACLGITPDANCQSKEEYRETELKILKTAQKYSPYHIDIEGGKL